MSAVADPAYLETLCLYYEEEIEGAAFFDALARVFDRAGQADPVRKLALLAEVERHAARAVAPLIAKYRLIPRSDVPLQASGCAAAGARPPDWAAFLDEMTATYPDYLAAFERLEAMAPPEDRPRLSMLTRHEVAALDFLALERTQPGQSAAPLRAYLALAAPLGTADGGAG